MLALLEPFLEMCMSYVDEKYEITVNLCRMLMEKVNVEQKFDTNAHARVLNNTHMHFHKVPKTSQQSSLIGLPILNYQILG